LQNVENKQEKIDKLDRALNNSVEDQWYIEQISDYLNNKYIDDEKWSAIRLNYNALHNNELEELREENNLTNHDIRLVILLKMGFSNSGIADKMNISIEGIKKAKQRLKKKLDLTKL